MPSIQLEGPPPLGQVRYIKLGRGDAYAMRSFEDGEIHFGRHSVPHELTLTGDRDAIVAHLTALGRSPGKAKDFAREVLDFYQLGPEVVWITFVDGYLWWAQAEPEVVWLGEADPEGGRSHGARFRRTRGPWRHVDINGRPLVETALSTKLTKVAAYRQTLCSLEPEAERYLRRKLAGQDEPTVAVAREAKQALVAAAADLIAALHWADFETMVDMILARGGWSRISALGGTLKDADLIVEQAVTQETALVQVKSSATQAVLDDYICRFQSSRYSRLIFVCHSPSGTLESAFGQEVIIWTRAELAETAIRNGLIDWLIERAG